MYVHKATGYQAARLTVLLPPPLLLLEAELLCPLLAHLILVPLGEDGPQLLALAPGGGGREGGGKCQSNTQLPVVVVTVLLFKESNGAMLNIQLPMVVVTVLLFKESNDNA